MRLSQDVLASCGPAARFEPMSDEWGWLVAAALPAYGRRAQAA